MLLDLLYFSPVGGDRSVLAMWMGGIELAQSGPAPPRPCVVPFEFCLVHYEE